jgi:serine/threonine-protein kinase
MLIAGALCAGSGSAGAADDKASAQAAFDLGKQLMVDGRFAEACPKFEESLRIQSGVGTMLFLAACYEKLGRTASAWAQFREAESLAGRVNDPRANVARERANALEPKLAKLRILVPASLRGLSNLEVKRDETRVGAGVFDAPIPVDPGPHRISVNAAGKKTWSGDVQIAPEDPRATIQLPAQLDDAPAGEPSSAPPRASDVAEGDDPGKTQRIAGLVTGGVGVVGLGVAGIFGLVASSKLDDSNADGHCHGADGNHCDPIGTSARNDARDAATVSTVAFIVGLAAVAGGAVLYFTAPKPPARSAARATIVAPWITAPTREAPNSAVGISIRSWL